MAKCVYMRMECVFEKTGKCGRINTCPYARQLMKAKKRGRKRKTKAV